MSNKMEFGFNIEINSIMEHKQGDKTSKVKSVEFLLTPSANLDRSMYIADEKTLLLTKQGSEAATATLVQGLVSNIHMAHQGNLIDSAQHLRKIISMLEKGFINNAEIITGETFTDLNDLNNG